jgi:hypothetical protein
MVDTLPVQSKEHFVTIFAEETDDEEHDLNNEQLSELYESWSEFNERYGDTFKLVVVPNWFSESDFESGRRPFIFANVEHDDPSSGAVLWSEAQLLDPSVVENQMFSQVPIDRSSGGVDIANVTDELDISDTDEYIDESGKAWVPRSLSTVFSMA